MKPKEQYLKTTTKNNKMTKGHEHEITKYVTKINMKTTTKKNSNKSEFNSLIKLK